MAAGSSSSTYRLTYFNLAGRAEPLRLLLAVSGASWTEERLSFPEWGARKAAGTASGEYVHAIDVYWSVPQYWTAQISLWSTPCVDFG